jgi:hypothetical protein
MLTFMESVDRAVDGREYTELRRQRSRERQGDGYQAGEEGI